MTYSHPNGFMSSAAAMERELDATLDQAFTAAREAEELLLQLELESSDRTDEEVDQFVSYVTGPGRTSEWDAVASRVSAGELTWRAVAEGQLARDPGIIEAHRSNPQIVSPEQLGSLDPNADETPTMDIEKYQQTTERYDWAEPVDDEEYFANPLFSTRKP